MDLEIKNQRFIVCGASSGFGRAIAETLLEEGASVIVIARREAKLQELKDAYCSQVHAIAGDLTQSATLDEIENAAKEQPLHGLILNSGGPPTGTPLETELDQWDDAYGNVMRWKVDLALRLAPFLQKNEYGRILFIESQSVKQPLPNLVLSNAFRAGVVGFAKSLALEIADHGVTVNVIAPGSHRTPAINRVIEKEVEKTGKSFAEVKEKMENSIPVGRFGKGAELASLAAWLLSPHAGYVTGQTISHDGGNIQGLFG